MYYLKNVFTMFVVITFIIMCTFLNNPIVNAASDPYLYPTAPVYSNITKDTSGTFIQADNAKLVITGRITHTNPKAPVINWQGSAIKANFTGTSLRVVLNDSGNNCYNVFIDGSLVGVLKCVQGDAIYVLSQSLADTSHKLEIFRRTESDKGATIFKGIYLDSGKTLLASPVALKRKIEFYGDSITSGACNEDGDFDQWVDFTTHNNYMSYAAITSRALNAEYRCMSVSGIGLVKGFNNVTMNQVWDKENYTYGSDWTNWNFLRWTPDVVVVNLGENDKACGVDAITFTYTYVSFIKGVVSKYPNAHIICAIGPMSAGYAGEAFRLYVSDAVAQLNQQGYTKVYFFPIDLAENSDGSINSDNCVWNHPRVAQHIEMAKRLETFIKTKIWPSTSPTPTNIPTSTNVEYGDVNKDDVNDSADYTLQRLYLLGKMSTLPNILATDNGDGAIDYTILRKYLLDIIGTLPYKN